eukprot:11169258-Lingulodinium_polyedra.AAC.1
MPLLRRERGRPRQSRPSGTRPRRLPFVTSRAACHKPPCASSGNGSCGMWSSACGAGPSIGSVRWW